MAIRLVIIDGHTLHRLGLTHLLQQHPDIEIVGEATTAADAVTMVTALRPDVVTVDVTLPDQNGLALARDLRDRSQTLGIVVLTSLGEDDILFRAMETGVSAFVPKTAPEQEITTAIRHAAVAASSFTAPGLLAALDRLRDARQQSPLTRRELDVLHQLHRGLSIPDVARALFVSPSTAKTYVARIYEKLGVSSRMQALQTATELGLLPRHPVAV